MVIIKMLRFLCITGAILIGIALSENLIIQIILGTLFGSIMRAICDIHDAKYAYENTDIKGRKDENENER